MSNPLIVGSVEMSTPFTGAFILESGEALCAAIESGDWVAGGMATFSAALDAVSMVIDPIGSLIAMGLGWLIEHLEPIKSWFNDLTGDAGEVGGFAATWTNIAAHLVTTGEDLAASVARLDGMSGRAVDAYRQLHGDAAAHLRASGDWANGISAGMQIASMIVKMVHDLTRDALSTIVGTAISAAVTTVATVGFGAPVAVAQVTSKVASLGARVATFITRLLTSMKNLIKLVGDLIDLYRRFIRSFDQAVPGQARIPGDAPAPARPTTAPTSQGIEVNSGGFRGPRRGEDPHAWAEDAYDEIRASSTDVDDILSNPTNLRMPDGSTLSRQDVIDIKSHVFVNEHLLQYGDGTSVTARFDAIPQQADAWFRLESGVATSSDRLFLLHELTELKYLRENPGSNYADAHAFANTIANWALQMGAR